MYIVILYAELPLPSNYQCCKKKFCPIFNLYWISTEHSNILKKGILKVSDSKLSMNTNGAKFPCIQLLFKNKLKMGDSVEIC